MDPTIEKSNELFSNLVNTCGQYDDISVRIAVKALEAMYLAKQEAELQEQAIKVALHSGTPAN